MRFYMAIGRPEINRKLNEASVVVNNTVKNLSKKEFVLWTNLAWNIHTIGEIQGIYNDYLSEINELESDFDDVMGRLEQRGLIASGRGLEIWTALYNLFNQVIIVPCDADIFTNILAFFQILISDKSFKSASKVYKKEKLGYDEKVILNLAKKARLSPTYIVDQLMYYEGKALNKTEQDANSYQEQRLSVLKSTATLYTKKYILFERRGQSNEQIN